MFQRAFPGLLSSDIKFCDISSKLLCSLLVAVKFSGDSLQLFPLSYECISSIEALAQLGANFYSFETVIFNSFASLAIIITNIIINVEQASFFKCSFKKHNLISNNYINFFYCFKKIHSKSFIG